MFETVKSELRTYLAAQSETVEDQRACAESFVWHVMNAFWEQLTKALPPFLHSPHLLTNMAALPALTPRHALLADLVGAEAADLDLLRASYEIGQIYTSLLPKTHRSQYGVYYTPPALTNRLIDLAEASGADWSSGTFLDPACGGGAFLAPIAARMKQDLRGMMPGDLVRHISTHLRGYEVDGFSGWMSQVFTEAMCLDICSDAGQRLPLLVSTRNTLAETQTDQLFDVVIGNPPYGKVRLAEPDRRRFARSLFGHANLYALFTDDALRRTKSDGLVAFVTPTSFLSGQYFKGLRKLLIDAAPPAHIDFVNAREGVFDDVLQETTLAIYRQGSSNLTVEVGVLDVVNSESLETITIGEFILPDRGDGPWILPRSAEQADMIQHLQIMTCRLNDYGYKVSTGPLVWNRHKDGFTQEYAEGRYPVIWAESILPSGDFIFRAEKANHQPYFEPNGREEWLIRHDACALLQRTTAKEQNRRLIAAELPADFVAEFDGVIVENHLNMLIPISANLAISIQALVVLLNSHALDQIFRCINGSVAVSAYELESIPLPPPDSFSRLEQMLQCRANPDEIEAEISRIYAGETHVAVLA